MCIRDRSMSNVVMDVTPNMIFVIGSDLKILDCNKKAQELLGVGREEAVQRYIFEFIETEDIEETLRTKEPIIHKKIRLEHGRMTAEETIVYIENLDSVLVTFQDVTREEKMKEQHYHLKVLLHVCEGLHPDVRSCCAHFLSALQRGYLSTWIQYGRSHLLLHFHVPG